MYHILGLDLTNVVTFKSLSVDFRNNLTYVRGLNLDSDRANPTSNGAGKSLMFSTFANVIYQSLPTSAKKRSKKDILKQKGSTVGLLMKPSDDAPDYEILQTGKGYKIYEDGVDLKVRTTPLCEAYIKNLFPMPEITFYSTCYLSTQRPYLLQKDSNANRLQHLTDIFHLDQYSGIREVLAKKRRTITDNEIKLSVLEQRVVTLRKKIADLKSPVPKAEYLELKHAYKEHGEKLEQLQKKRFELLTLQRDLEALLKIERTLDELRSRYAFKKPPDVMLRSFKKQKEAAAIWDRYDHRSAQNDKLRKTTQEKIDALDMPAVPQDVAEKYCKQLERRIKEATAEIRTLSDVKTRHDDLEERLTDISEKISEFGVKIDPDVDYDAEIAVLRSTLRLEKLLHSHDEGEDSSECPTCLTMLDMEALKKTVNSAKKRLPKMEECAEYLRLKTKWNELNKEQRKLKFNEATLESLVKRTRKDKADLAVHEEYLETYRKHASLLEHLESIKKIKTPDLERPDHSDDELTEYIDLCTSIVDALSSKAVLTDNGTELVELRTEQAVVDKLALVERSLSKADKEVDRIRELQSNAAATVSACDHFKNTHSLYTRELKEANADIAVLAPSVGDKKILDILLKAYGAKGLRSKAAESVCALLQTNLNHYRDLIFAEPFEFEVESTDTGVSILVDRNNGKPDSVSDVRSLSGAESNCFQLLCLISLLPLIPHSGRVNLAILDEPTSHMDEVSRQIFNSRFVPVLREIVPNVVIITPHQDDRSENSVEWLVVKEDGISTLKTAA